MKITSSLIEPIKNSLANAAIGRLLGKRPAVEWLTQQDSSKWNLSKPCLISLTERGHFLFRFNSKEDRDLVLPKSPILLQSKKLHLLPRSPGQGYFEWPSLRPVWIRLHGIPYHCWSSNILLSLASSIGRPLKLDEITASQRILTYANILVNLDLPKPKPHQIKVDLEGESEVFLSIAYENPPCAKCFSTGHTKISCQIGNPVLQSKPIPPGV